MRETLLASFPFTKDNWRQSSLQIFSEVSFVKQGLKSQTIQTLGRSQTRSFLPLELLLTLRIKMWFSPALSLVCYSPEIHPLQSGLQFLALVASLRMGVGVLQPKIVKTGQSAWQESLSGAEQLLLLSARPPV